VTHVRVVGIGCHPGQLTLEAREAIAGCDYVIAANKGPDDPLLALRRAICADLGVELVAVPDPPRDRDDPADYDGAVLDWHDARAAAYGSLLDRRPGTVGFLVWGDPAFYDSTIRVVDRLGVPYDVLPGVSALSLLAARHRVVLHEVGRPVLVTTGRRLSAEVAAGHDNLVVMLDVSRRGVGHLVGRQPRQPCRGARGRAARRRRAGDPGGAGACQGRRRMGDGHLPPAPPLMVRHTDRQL
jgi:precorrin-6A synthase